MTKWEYGKLNVLTDDLNTETFGIRLEKYGEDGWEMCGIGTQSGGWSCVWFKREVVAAQPEREKSIPPSTRVIKEGQVPPMRAEQWVGHEDQLLAALREVDEIRHEMKNIGRRSVAMQNLIDKLKVPCMVVFAR